MDTTELHDHVDRLMRAPSDGAFLIISVYGTTDFLQLSGDPQGVQIDFPLITDRQLSLESKIRSAAEAEGLVVVENKGSDGSRFLDIDIEEDAAGVTRVCRVLLRDVFGAGETAQLEFEGDGLA
jgi:hypothetical protein